MFNYMLALHKDIRLRRAIVPVTTAALVDGLGPLRFDDFKALQKQLHLPDDTVIKNYWYDPNCDTWNITILHKNLRELNDGFAAPFLRAYLTQHEDSSILWEWKELGYSEVIPGPAVIKDIDNDRAEI